MTTRGGAPAQAERIGRTERPADLVFLHRPARDTIDLRRVRQRLVPCPEIDCLRALLPPGQLAAAELRAAEIGTGADRVLVASGAISDEDYATALAHSLGLDVETFEDRERQDFPLDDDRLIDAAAAGTITLRRGGVDRLVIAPGGLGARHLLSFLSAAPALSARVSVTTRAHLNAFVERCGAAAIGWRAAYALRSASGDLSAGARGSRILLWLAVVAISFGAVADPDIFVRSIDLALAGIFLGWTALRLIGVLTTIALPSRSASIGEDRLPVYTVIVALYREDRAVAGLVRALSAIDYPKEKLDIKLIVESDDMATRDAISHLGLHAPFQVVVAPSVGPRTKPKALNAALPFALGRFIAVYDAEDRPEPDQLRRAIEAFAATSKRVACVQARLTIDNTSDSWLTRLFTAEYAGLFDVFLPGVAAWHLPLPLGGSSNHFRADVLRKVGAWDPFNVTEDADLGMRLARFGYRSAMIESATYEEAPGRFFPWLRQRTRWFKGWMQTWLVHMRHPLRLYRDLGMSGFFVFQLVVGGTVLAALVHPVFAGLFLWQTLFQSSIPVIDNMIDVVITGLHGTTLAAGYLISIVLGAVGLARRGLSRYAWSLLLTPVYWIILSMAAWRALLQLIVDPYRWEKTEHGLARTSRLRQRDETRSQ